MLLHALHPVNLLSFGPETPEIPLRALNLLIGPNGSGKSNFIEAIGLLRDSASDMKARLRTGGGVTEWIWKGSADKPASLDAIIANVPGRFPLRHRIEFGSEQQTFRLIEERIENKGGNAPSDLFYHYSDGSAVVGAGKSYRLLPSGSITADQSILTQRKDPEQYPQITHVAEQYARIRIYREWSFGRNTVFRQPQRADGRNDRMEEDFSNLGLFLNRLRRSPEAKNAILTRLRDLYEGADDFDVSVEGGTVQVYFAEGRYSIPATRLSDGTLRYLCLLAILCDPKPPPLICIEEPELGLHPDILPKIADLLIEASRRTQLIVTTHSDILVDAMTEQPESVMVCEKRDGQTHIERLSAENLSVWLEKYRLGELWTRGELGGNRW